MRERAELWIIRRKSSTSLMYLTYVPFKPKDDVNVSRPRDLHAFGNISDPIGRPERYMTVKLSQHVSHSLKSLSESHSRDMTGVQYVDSALVSGDPVEGLQADPQRPPTAAHTHTHCNFI